MPRITGFFALLCLALGASSCSDADPEAEAEVTAQTRLGSRAAVDEARLVRLIDARLKLALARERAFADLRAGQVGARSAIAEAQGSARSLLDGSGAIEGDARQTTEQLVGRLDEFSEEVETLDQRDADLEAFEADVHAALDDVAGVQTIYASDGASGSPIGADLLAGIQQNLNGVLTILDQVKQARTALELIATGSVPDDYAGSASSDYYPDDEYYDDYEDEYFEDDYAGYDDSYSDSEPDPGAGQESEPTLQAEPARIDGRGSPALARAEADSYEGLRLEVLGLRRTSGGTVMLELALQNSSDAEVALSDRSLFSDRSNYGWNLQNVGLVDLASGRRFTVMRDSEGNAMASAGTFSDHTMAPGERRELWARFDSVPGDVRYVSVAVPGFPPVDDIEIRG